MLVSISFFSVNLTDIIVIYKNIPTAWHKQCAWTALRTRDSDHRFKGGVWSCVMGSDGLIKCRGLILAPLGPRLVQQSWSNYVGFWTLVVSRREFWLLFVDFYLQSGKRDKTSALGKHSSESAELIRAIASGVS